MNSKQNPTVWLTVAAVSIASLAGMIGHSSFAQDASSRFAQNVAARQAAARGGMSEDEVVARHSVLKRATAAKSTQVDPTVIAESGSFNSDQGPGAGPIGPGQGCDLFPAPANIGTAVPLSYFGPPPSSVNQSLVGPVQLSSGVRRTRNRI